MRAHARAPCACPILKLLAARKALKSGRGQGHERRKQLRDESRLEFFFRMGASRMPPCDRLPQAVTMPAAIGTERFVLISVASLLHAKATEPPPTGDSDTAVSSVSHPISITLTREPQRPATRLYIRDSASDTKLDCSALGVPCRAPAQLKHRLGASGQRFSTQRAGPAPPRAAPRSRDHPWRPCPHRASSSPPFPPPPPPCSPQRPA